jgi:hypothetical protein
LKQQEMPQFKTNCGIFSGGIPIIKLHPILNSYLTPILYNRGTTKFQKEMVSVKLMTIESPNLPRSKKRAPLPPVSKPASPTGDPIRNLWQPDLKTLSPLQRQRLDTAVMLLVNYLISASSQS